MLSSKTSAFVFKSSFLLGLFCLLTLAVGVKADDGGISFGGSPHLLKGHSSVTMESEVVSIDIHDKVIKVDCLFLFHNHGPKCIVRMGFPDEGLGASEPYQGFPVPKGPGLKATFLTYDSWVDGKKVPTKLVPTDDRSLYWHAKTVTFNANSDCKIRDVYTLPPGAQVTSENGMYNQTYYVLHTGASWHGPIGKAQINVKFGPDVLPQPIHLIATGALPEGQKFPDLKWSKLPTGTVIYDGPSEPKVDGKTLSFTKTNFSPSEKDDVRLFYGYRQLTNMP